MEGYNNNMHLLDKTCLKSAIDPLKQTGRCYTLTPAKTHYYFEPLKKNKQFIAQSTPTGRKITTMSHQQVNLRHWIRQRNPCIHNTGFATFHSPPSPPHSSP